MKRQPGTSRRHRRPAPALLSFEPLEDRAVPTIVFAPAFGPETIVDKGGPKLDNAPLILIFWGKGWAPAAAGQPPTANQVAMNADIAAASTLCAGPYTSKLAQYGGYLGKIFYGGYVIDSASDPQAGFNGGAIQGEVDHEISTNKVGAPGPPPYAPIYAVITLPGVTSGVANAGSFNTGESNPPGGLAGGVCSDLWIRTDGTVDTFTLNLSHETVEGDTDPLNGSSIVASDGPNWTLQPGERTPAQICDFEAQNYAWRVNGLLLQSYWSRADAAFIVPDGNSLNFNLSGGTLTLRGGQAGATADTVTLNDDVYGDVTATFDGQTVAFAPGFITNVNVYQGPSSPLTVNVTGTWTWSEDYQAPISVFTSWANAAPTRININASPGSLEPPAPFPGTTSPALVSVNDPARNSVVTINAQADPYADAWTLDGGTDSVDGTPLIASTGAGPAQLYVNTNSAANSVDIEGSPCTTYVNFGAGPNSLTFAAQVQNLNAIAAPVFLSGTVSSLTFEDQADPASVVATIDRTGFSQTNSSYVSFPAAASIAYYAGSGNDTISVAPTSKSLETLAPNVSVTGGSGKDSMIVNDSGDTNATEFGGQYTISEFLGGSIARNYWEKLGTSLVNLTDTINYLSLSGGVTLDTDGEGSSVDLEGSFVGIPLTVNLGAGTVGVTVASQSQSIANLGTSLTVNGGTGTDYLTVDDQRDPYAPSSPYLVVAGSRDEVLRSVPVSPYSTGIYYSGFKGGLTLNTDNNGTPVDVEGLAGPTTVNLGSGNTTVETSEFSESLAQFTFPSFTPVPLNLNGGTGTDSLIVNDQDDPWSLGGPGYTVNAGSIIRANYGGSDPTPAEAIINYAGFDGGVTLYADPNGTPVDVEGTSAPTSVDLGTGNTAVSVAAVGKSLVALGSDLTIVGGSGSDSLTVNDSLDPLASSSTRTSSNTYSYSVTGQAITRTRSYRGLYVARFPRTINESSMSAVTLDTDNNGTPLDVEGTSAPTTVNVGSGNTPLSVTSTGQNLGLLGGDLTVNGGAGTDSLVINDALNPLASNSSRFSSNLYNYTIAAQSVSRTWNSYGLLHMWSTRSVNFAGMKGGVTLQADAHSTPVTVSSATGPNPVTVTSPTGADTLTAPNAANSWSLTGKNAGSLDGWVTFSGFANLNGGGSADSFDFTPAGAVTGSINGNGGNDLLNYVRVSAPVTVNLSTGKATGVGGSVAGIQGVVGGSAANTLTGSSRCLLIGGAGPSQLSGGGGDSLMIAGSTIYGLQDAALEAILAEWDRTDLDFAHREADLTSGGGLNGSNVLTTSTVSANGKANTITSNAGQSWIFARTSDVILGRKTGDVWTPLP